jgi:two-component system, NtrC family, nitrogen regulation sensor histidine kinase NtrY
MGSRAPTNPESSAAVSSDPAEQTRARAAPASGIPASGMLNSNTRRGEQKYNAASRQPKNRTLSFERRIHILCGLLVAPGLILSFLLLWKTKTPWPAMAGLLGFIALLCLIVMATLSEQIVRPLQTLANVVASLREGDYSFRARNCSSGDALSEVSLEINQLADMMQGQRLSELEATTLLRNVVRSMDAPVLAFDPKNVLRLINPAAEALLGIVAERALGLDANELRLAELLDQPDQGVLLLAGRRNADRWMVRRSTFRQSGVPHTLLILSDVSAALREQEREAWRRLIRVLGHEINNSLTPIKSIAATLRSRTQAPEMTNSPDFDRALKIIESRADSLNRFIQAYRQLAQLPQPAFRRTALRPLLERVTALETRVRVQFEPGPDLLLEIDADQIEQLMINLIRNAAESSLARSAEHSSGQPGQHRPPEVGVSWKLERGFVEIVVMDNGIGLSNPSNLFVPFYTTKAGGTGVGLALARQICEAHGGEIYLKNRLDSPGCEAHVRFRISVRDLEQ